MKRCVWVLVLLITVSSTFTPAVKANAAFIPLILTQAVIKKAIKAMDLKIQRLQNKTIWLQNAQKVMENTLSKLKLKEISDWTKKQRDQYQQYYDELLQVKTTISYYQRVKEVTQKQARLVAEYERAWGLLKKDTHFTESEINYMERVYGGILRETSKNFDQILLLLKTFSLRMNDADRLKMINDAADRVDENYDDLNRFNNQNKLLSLQRAKTQGEIEAVKKLYGIQQ